MVMKNNLLKRLLVAITLLWHTSVMAEDIDLFVDPQAIETTVPNVLIVLDNTANWSTAFTNEMAALKSVLDGLTVNKFRVGLMLYSETGGGNGNPGGAYVRAALRMMDATNKTTYSNLITSLSESGDRGNGRALGLAMMEAYAYFDGQTAYAGANKVKRDYAGNTNGSLSTQSRAVYALPGNAFVSSTSATYVPPTAAACPKNYIIYIGNTTATGNVTKDNNSDNTTASDKLKALGTASAIAEIPISPSGFSDNVANEWALFMKNSVHNISTYTIDVSQGDSGNGPANSALLKSMATVSGGDYFKVSSTTSAGAEISNALNNIFSKIQSVNSVFASVSLPVSVNTQGTYLNQVYVGMFRPDANRLPRWNGNLKQYKLGFEGTGQALKLLDADDADAINPVTGFVAECARSYWTPLAVDSYWEFSALAREGGCIGKESSNSPDGNIVEKGAQAFVLRSSPNRVVKTCAAAGCDTLLDFNAANVTTANLGAASSTERDTIISWLRGLDVQDENSNEIKDGTGAAPNNVAEMRSSVHGDIVHSRPVAIEYGTGIGVVVFYGGNDGLLRAVNGNRGDSPADSDAGRELWSFVPPEFFSKIKRNYDNSVAIAFAGYDNTDARAKDYGVDGPVTAYNEGGVAYLYVTMRRGGNAIYAFDVTNPESPALMWRKDSGDLSELGQTWSAAKVFKTSQYGDTPLLIMGGGYDTCHDEDTDTNNCGSLGKQIFIMDGVSGSLLASFATESSVIADATIIPDSNGNAKYIYIADLGGNVYRISGATSNAEISPSTAAAEGSTSFTMTKIASFGGAGVDNRKFMFGPDVVDENGTYVLLLGSGDREKPVDFYSNSNAVSNRFYMIKDQPANADWLASEATNCGGVPIICEASLFAITTNDTPSNDALNAKKGWSLGMNTSEQVVTSAITVFGTVTFSTHQPTGVQTDACTPSLGTARVYNINYRNAAPIAGFLQRGSEIAGGGLPPSPVAGQVILDDGSIVPFIIGSGVDSALQGGLPPTPPTVSRPKSRVYWNIKK
jgi:type IV pilus assembly protein PilY1